MAILHMKITLCHHHDVGQLSSTKLHYQSKWSGTTKNKHMASPKSDNMKTQPSTPTSKVSVGLQNINNTNKRSTVTSYLKLYFSYTSSGIFLWLDSPEWAYTSSFLRLRNHTQLGMKNMGLLYTLVTSKFINSF
jgi:hypothetical protein